MKSKIQLNSLSKRTKACLSKAGLAIDKKAIVDALIAGRLYPFRWPPNYGLYTHVEVCRWVGIDHNQVPPPSPEDAAPYPENGLSYRANRCLSRAGILATKPSVRQALLTGLLSPGKRPGNYGRKTHAELCRWAIIDPARLPRMAMT